MSSEYDGSLRYRIESLERRMGRLEDLEPAVVRSQVLDTRDDIQNLTKAVDGIRKILMTFLIAWSGIGITVVVALFTARA